MTLVSKEEAAAASQPASKSLTATTTTAAAAATAATSSSSPASLATQPSSKSNAVVSGEARVDDKRARPPLALAATELQRQRDERLKVWASISNSERVFCNILRSDSGRQVLKEEVNTRLRALAKLQQQQLQQQQQHQLSQQQQLQHASTSHFLSPPRHTSPTGGSALYAPSESLRKLATVDAYNAMFAGLIRESKSRALADFRKSRPPICEISSTKQWLRIPYKAPQIDADLYRFLSAYPGREGAATHPPRPKKPVNSKDPAIARLDSSSSSGREGVHENDSLNISTGTSPNEQKLSLDSLREPLLLRIVDFLVLHQPPREAARQLALLDMVHRKFCYSSLSVTELVAREISFCCLPPNVAGQFVGKSWKWSVFVADTTFAAICSRSTGGEYNVRRKSLNLAWKGIGDYGVALVAAALRNPDSRASEPVEEMRLGDNKLTGHGIKFFAMAVGSSIGGRALQDLLSLNLEDNLLGRHRGAELVAKIVPRLPALEELFLGGNGISTRSANYVFRAVVLHRSLRVVGLGGNSIDSIKVLLETIKSRDVLISASSKQKQVFGLNQSEQGNDPRSSTSGASAGNNTTSASSAGSRTMYLSGNPIPESQLRQLKKDGTFLIF
eukprot:INCI4194.3.p1 GENE.INCI4194.3~~INCI4194.3.p1  ORF type:complete len:617 (-),score=115.40 INCI4194.3:259-2109(-)